MQVFSIYTPSGWMAGAWSEAGLKALVLPQKSPEASLEKLAGELRILPVSLPVPSPVHGLAQPLADEIERYFRGEKVLFSTLIDWSGYTPFQRRVLEITRAIPHGEVRSYGLVALEAGSPRGARAVGGVMRSNRTPLVIPCHRVLAAGGSLGGFSGGLDVKEHLLKLESNKHLSRKSLSAKIMNEGVFQVRMPD